MAKLMGIGIDRIVFKSDLKNGVAKITKDMNMFALKFARTHSRVLGIVEGNEEYVSYLFSPDLNEEEIATMEDYFD